MWHTCAYSASVANGLTNTTLNALADNVFRIGPQNGFVLQEDMMLLTAEVLENNATASRLTAPKFAQFDPIQLVPLQGGAKTTTGLAIATWPYRAPTFRNQEEVVCKVDTGGTAAATETVVVCFSNGIDPIPNGEELTLKFTSTTTVTAFSWTLATLVMDQTVPEGLYAMISSEIQSTNAMYHRWTFWNQFYRPGMPSTTVYTNPQFGGARDYRQGLLGQFSNVTLPNCEILASVADASHTGFMRVIKVA